MNFINSLPEDIILDCIARVPRRDYPTLSLVSKYFRTLIKSHELYARRVLLDRIDYCLYVTITTSDNNGGDVDRLCILRHNFNSPDKKYSLVPVTSLSRIPPRGSYVTVDSKIFVIPNDESLSSTDTLLIDCRFHTAHHVPSMMPNEVGSSVFKYNSVGEISIGGHKVGTRMKISEGVVMFLNQSPVCTFQLSYKSAMTFDNIFLMTSKADIFNSKAWYENDCFLDGVSYFYNPRLRKLQAFDIRHVGRPIEYVKGVELMTGEDVNLSRTVIYGQKVVVFWQKDFDEKKEIWCAEIKVVGRDQERELCGRVEWCGCVLEGQWLTLKNSLVVKA